MTTDYQYEDESAAALPEKFKDPETGAIRTNALLSSYLELEKKLSSGPDRAGMLRALGVPETPDEYEVDVSHGLFTVDHEMNCRLHNKGFTCEQVQEVYDLAAEKLVPAILDIMREHDADREIEKLAAAFGGPEKWRDVSRQILAFGKKNLSPGVLESLSSSFEGVMALYRMMKGEEPGIALRGGAAAETTGPGNETELRSLMRDPRYWREKDPSFVAKVTDGFQKIYNDAGA